MSSVSRGRQIKTDQAKLLEEAEAGYTYKIIENTPEGLVLQKALEALDNKFASIDDRLIIVENRGAIAHLDEIGKNVTGFTSAYISAVEPDPPIILPNGSEVSTINEGDLWFDTTNNVVKRYTGTEWAIKGAAYL